MRTTSAECRGGGDSPLRFFYVLPLVMIIVVFVAATCQQNTVWLDEASLWKHVLVHAPQKWRAYYPIGLHYFRGGQYPDAIPYLEQAAQHQPFHVPIYWDLAAAYRNAGRRDRVIETYQKALAALTVLDEPSAIQRFYEIRMHNELALVLIEQGSIAEARNNLNEVLLIDPVNAEARSLLMRVQHIR